MDPVGVDPSDVIVFDPPTPPRHRAPQPLPVPPPSIPEPRRTRNPSSDSDSDVEPVVKRKRATKTARNNSRNTTEDDVELPNCAIYTGQVTSSLFGSTRPPISMEPDPDDVEDDHDLLAKTRRGRKRQRSDEKKQAAAAAKVAAAAEILSSDDDEILLVSPTAADRERSPTPPPSCLAKAKTRKTRMARGTMKAMGELCKINTRLKMSEYRQAYENTISDCATVIDSPEKTRGLCVLIRTVHGETERIEMQKTQTFEAVMKHMAKRLKTEEDNIKIYFGDQLVELFDTPHSLALTITDILDCHLATGVDTACPDEEMNNDDPTMIRLCIQGKDKRQEPFSIRIKRKMPLEKLMRQYASDKKEALKNLKFSFDGDTVRLSDTAEGLDMEEDDVIDVTRL